MIDRLSVRTGTCASRALCATAVGSHPRFQSPSMSSDVIAIGRRIMVLPWRTFYFGLTAVSGVLTDVVHQHTVRVSWTNLVGKAAFKVIMSLRRQGGVLGALLLALAEAGCGSSGDGPPAPTAPGTLVASLEELEGSWAGWYSTGKAVNLCWGVVWSPRLGGPGVTGPSALGGFGDPMPTPFNATTTGSLSGGTLSIAIDSTPPGTRPLACALTGSGTVQAGQTTMSGTLTVTWTPQCGFPEPYTYTGTLTLTKGGRVPNFCP